MTGMNATPRTIKVAAIQMDANPAPIAQRLARAGRLVAKAAEAGARLIVLPELFNSGYAYDDANFGLAEPIDGLTAAWMKDTAARFDIHLAGSLLVLDKYEVYNALLLFAPDGHMWRYDKLHPWGWERGYFRAGGRIVVAKTELGDLGMLICWDVAHADLWRQYAGNVDMMLIASCPPDLAAPVYHFPDGGRVTADDMGPFMVSMKGLGQRVFGDMINQQAAWLGVPAVNTVASGHIQTAIPNGRAALLAFLPAAPWLVKYLSQADKMRVSCNLVPGCKVVDNQGRVLAELTQDEGETSTMAEVVLAAEKPSPRGPQPRSGLPWQAYLVSDILLPALAVPVYRNGLRRLQSGEPSL
jgi:predicted amidohydrolase